jgi:hypothetical protein
MKHKLNPPYRTGTNWKVLREKVIKRDKWKCQACGKLTYKPQVHHITPRRQGGTNKLSNLVTLCGRCHMIISPVPPFALKRAFGVRESEIPAERQRVYRGIQQFLNKNKQVK